MATDHLLSPQDIRFFFHHFGWLLPFANVVDSEAYRLLLGRGHFSSAESVLEVGAGFGMLAQLLLRDHLPRHAKCTLIEVAGSLAEILRSRFLSYGTRVNVELVDVSPPFPFIEESYDRIISTYVFEMMNRKELGAMVNEMHRILSKNGLLCMLGTGQGYGVLSKLVMLVHSILYRMDPRLVGISRPIDVLSFFHSDQWEVVSVDYVSSFGFPSEIMILKKLA